jgi:hypothetical protein
MSKLIWSEVRKIGTLYYKFKQNPDGRWEILASGDKASLETKSVATHDHYWQRDGRWYCQVKREKRHLMAPDDFIEGIKRQNSRNELTLSDAEKQKLNLAPSWQGNLTKSQIIQLSKYRAAQAYGNAVPGGQNCGVEVSSYEAKILDRLVKQYQAQTSVVRQDSTLNKIKWQLHNAQTQEDTTDNIQLSRQQIKWQKEKKIENLNPSLNENREIRKRNRKMTR